MNVWQKFKGWIAKKMNFTVETSPAMKEESFLEWLGVKRKNKDVMAEVTYFTCLKMMSETLAKIPWKYYQKTEKGIIEPELSDVAKLLKNRPNPFILKALIQKSKLCFLYIKFPLRSQFKICLHLIESGQQDNL